MHSIPRSLASRAILALAALALPIACGGGGHSANNTPGALSGHLTVFAASSLTDAFSREKDAFIAANPRVSIEFNFAGSSTLVTQLQQGAPADVLATAAQKNMDTALQNGSVVDAGKVFVKNRLAVIVPNDNPAKITSPFDLGKSGIKLVIAAAGVPAGDYARQIFMKLEGDPRGGVGFSGKVLGNVISNAANVKAVVSTIQLGEADAGIVYATDVTPDIAGDMKVIDIPDEFNVVATYPIAVTADAGSPDIARAFIEFVLSAQGQQVLAGYGFLSP